MRILFFSFRIIVKFGEWCPWLSDIESLAHIIRPLNFHIELRVFIFHCCPDRNAIKFFFILLGNVFRIWKWQSSCSGEFELVDNFFSLFRHVFLVFPCYSIKSLHNMVIFCCSPLSDVYVYRIEQFLPHC